MISPNPAMHETIACKAMKIAARKVIQEGAQHSDETLIKKLTGPFGAGSQACGSTVGLTYVHAHAIMFGSVPLVAITTL